MTIETELLPLPEWMSRYTIPSDGFECDKVVMLDDRMHDYALANIAYAVAPLQAEIERLAEALEEIRGRTCINEAMNPDPFALTAMLGDIHQIADAALAKEKDNER